MKRLHRQNGPLDLELIPELGGAIGKLTWHGREILRSLPDGQNVKVNQGGCFPLVPYSNRIAHGRFHFTGCDYALLRNFGDHPTQFMATAGSSHGKKGMQMMTLSC